MLKVDLLAVGLGFGKVDILRKSQSPANLVAKEPAWNKTSERSAPALLIHVHICPICDCASWREDPDGMPDAAGVFHCSRCGHQGPLNTALIEEMDDRLRR